MTLPLWLTAPNMLKYLGKQLSLFNKRGQSITRFWTQTRTIHSCLSQAGSTTLMLPVLKRSFHYLKADSLNRKACGF